MGRTLKAFLKILLNAAWWFDMCFFTLESNSAGPLKFVISCYWFCCLVWKNFWAAILPLSTLGLKKQRIIFYIEIVLEVMGFCQWMGRWSSGGRVLL